MKDLKLLGVVITLTFISLLLPSALAFDCKRLGKDFASCSEIEGSELEEAEKEILIPSLLAENTAKPDHGFVYRWNTEKEVNERPEGAGEYGNGYIKNAWMKIFTIMPSVIENETLYSSGKGGIFTAYNYGTNIPSEKQAGDCRTEYSKESEIAELKVYLNSALIGGSKLTSFSSDAQDLDFKAKLDIDLKTRIRHYKIKNVGENEIRCEFDNEEIKHDSLAIEDSFKAKLYGKLPEADFRILNQYYGTSLVKLDASNFTALKLEFNDSFYELNKFFYSFNYSLKPYNIITIKADEDEQKSVGNLKIAAGSNSEGNDLSFAINDLSGCKIRLFTHFLEKEQECNLDYNKIDLKIKTDKLRYKINETIKVEIFPKNIPISLAYGNESKTAENIAEFKALLLANKIKADYNGLETEKLINVSDAKSWPALFSIGTFSFLNYFLYTLARKFYGGWI